MIKTRFAPSPTGWLHIGGVRTALFSWLFAKSQNGEFLVRIDDTDTTRSTQQYCDAIISALNSLGLNSDQDLIYQSKRFDIYIDRIESLLEKGVEEKSIPIPLEYFLTSNNCSSEIAYASTISSRVKSSLSL